MKNVQPLSLSIFLFSLLVAAGGWFLLIPAIKTTTSQLAQIRQLNDAYAAMAIPTNGSDQDATKIATLTAQAQSLLPTTDNQYDLLIQVDAAGKNQGLPFSSLNITPVDPNGAATAGVPLPTGTRGVVMNLANSASYADTGRLLQSLLSLNRLVRVDQLSLSGAQSAQPGGLSAGSLNVVINATALYSPVITTAPVTPKK